MDTRTAAEQRADALRELSIWNRTAALDELSDEQLTILVRWQRHCFATRGRCGWPVSAIVRKERRLGPTKRYRTRFVVYVAPWSVNTLRALDTAINDGRVTEVGEYETRAKAWAGRHRAITLHGVEAAERYLAEVVS